MQAYLNTDRELYREGEGDGNGMSYYENSVHVTKEGNIGMKVGGKVIVLSIADWHAAATMAHNISWSIKEENEQAKRDDYMSDLANNAVSPLLRKAAQEVLAENECPTHMDKVHYYGAISIDEGQCSCGARIRQNNSGH